MHSCPVILVTIGCHYELGKENMRWIIMEISCILRFIMGKEIDICYSYDEYIYTKHKEEYGDYLQVMEIRAAESGTLEFVTTSFLSLSFQEECQPVSPYTSCVGAAVYNARFTLNSRMTCDWLTSKEWPKWQLLGSWSARSVVPPILLTRRS